MYTLLGSLLVLEELDESALDEGITLLRRKQRQERKKVRIRIKSFFWFLLLFEEGEKEETDLSLGKVGTEAVKVVGGVEGLAGSDLLGELGLSELGNNSRVDDGLLEVLGRSSTGDLDDKLCEKARLEVQEGAGNSSGGSLNKSLFVFVFIVDERLFLGWGTLEKKEKQKKKSAWCSPR